MPGTESSGLFLVRLAGGADMVLFVVGWLAVAAGLSWPIPVCFYWT